MKGVVSNFYIYIHLRQEQEQNKRLIVVLLISLNGVLNGRSHLSGGILLGIILVPD